MISKEKLQPDMSIDSFYQNPKLLSFLTSNMI